VARSEFGGVMSAWVVSSAPAADASSANVRMVTLLAEATTLQVYDSPAGALVTDLLDELGDPIEELTISPGDPYIPRFSGPDGVTSLWAQADSGRWLPLPRWDDGAQGFVTPDEFPELGDARYVRLDAFDSTLAREVPTISAASHGAVGNGTTDDTVALKAAITAATTAKGVVDFGIGKTYKVTSRLDLPVGIAGYQGRGVTLDCSAMPDTEEYAVRFLPGATDATIYTYWVEGLRILGPASEASNLDGVFIGRPDDIATGNVAGYSFHNVTVRGFRDNWTFGPQSWLFGFFQCSSSAAWRRGYNIDAQANAGENYSWHGGVIADCTNTAGTGVGVYASQAGNSDINFFGTSFDYCDKEVDVQSGHVALIGCHLEDNVSGPMVTVTTTGGSEPGKLSVTDCVFAGTEADAGGRASFITVDGERSVVRVTGGSWSRFGKSASELVTVTAGTPLVTVDHVDPVIDGNAAPLISGYTSTTANGDFENDLAGWSLPATVNYIRNNTMTGAATGTPGTRPSGWVLAGSLNGLTSQFVSIDSTSGRPTLVWKLSGTPTAGGTYGFYPEANSVPAAAGQAWTHAVYLRAVGALTGIGGVNVGVQERTSGGVNVGGVDVPVIPTPVRARYQARRVFTAPTVAFAQPSLQVSFTSGVPVDATIAIDLPTLTLDGDPQQDVASFNSAATFPGGRHAIDTTTFRSGTKSLKITNGGTGTYGLYRLVPCQPGARLFVRGYVQTTVVVAGGAGYRIEWLTAGGQTIGTAITVGGSNVTADSTWTQRANAYTAPVGATQARVWAWTDTFNGTAWFDDLTTWTL
jgi:hypothetical protein